MTKVEVENAAKPFPAANGASTVAVGWRLLDQSVAKALMVSLLVIMRDMLGKDLAQVSSTQLDHAKLLEQRLILGLEVIEHCLQVSAYPASKNREMTRPLRQV